ncbi:MAG: hypothetical protein M0R03_20025 [Novosphingobium sp.]|jgi:hypothetical protein|nr:hypothetical protein [Novosphingobium sp.]
MFSSTVTVFNYDEPTDKFYPTLFTGVEFQPDYKINFTNNSTQDMDMSLLIIMYYIDGNNVLSYGNNKPYKPPKAWENLKTACKSKYFTFQTGRDFFVLGDYTSSTNADYELFKTEHDDVFFINSIKNFRDELKHFEIMGY